MPACESVLDMLGISDFAVSIRHGCALEADSNSEIDCTFFLLVSKTSVTRNAVLRYALVRKERIIRRQHF